MKRILRVGICLLLCACLSLGLIASALAASGDEIRAAKKIISVVYDDSGSMQNQNRYVYANYATQAMTALLNEQDELSIVYMSKPDQLVPADLQNMDSTLAAIRRIDCGGNTPEAAIDTAYGQLAGSSETDRTTQFWLVVMTDGRVFWKDNSGEMITDELRQKLLGYAGTSMSNGSALNVIYFSMDTSLAMNADPGAGFYTFSAENSSAIGTELQKIASLVSGRITADKVKTPDGMTVQFESDLPLYSISVLTHNSSASITAAEVGGQTLICRNVALEKSGINGNAATLYNQDASGTLQVIPAGSYTIHLSADVAADQLTVQYEPAIGMKAVLSSGGNPVDATTALLRGDTVDITLIPVVPGTDQEIPEKDLPAGIEWTVACELNGTEIASDKSRTLKDISLETGNTVIRGSMQIPGFTPLTYEVSLDVEDSFRDLGIDTEQPDDLSYKRTDLATYQNNEYVKFYITSEGNRLSPEQIRHGGLSLQIDEVTIDDSEESGIVKAFGKIPAGCRLRQTDDGGYELRAGAKVPFGACFLKAGSYTVRVSIVQDGSVTATGTFRAVPGRGDWPQVIGLLALLYVLFSVPYSLFGKPTFRRQTIASDQYEILKNGAQKGKGKHVSGPTVLRLGRLSGNRLLMPWRPGKVRFKGLELVATRDGGVDITGKSIAASCAAYGPGSNNPLQHAGTIAKSMIATKENGRKRQVSDRSVSTTPLYFRDSATSPYIWNLYQKK